MFDTYPPTTSADIAARTKADLFWRFYTETRIQIADLEEKRELYLREYLKEMKRSDIPMELRGEFIATIQTDPTSCKTKEEKESRELRIKMVTERLFSEDFRKNFNIAYAGKLTGGYEGYYYTLLFHIGGIEYRLQCPNPAKIPDKMLSGQGAMCDVLQYRADKIPITESGDLVKKLDCVHFPTYNWKECSMAIERDAAVFCKERQ